MTDGDCIRSYTKQLKNGLLPKAYRIILSFLSDLSGDLQRRYPDYTAGALYAGYLDMSYFAITPPALREKRLKIAVVYLHQKGCFEGWLCGGNRAVKAEYTAFFLKHGHGSYRLSETMPGVDSILETDLSVNPDFDYPVALKQQIEQRLWSFLENINTLLAEP